MTDLLFPSFQIQILKFPDCSTGHLESGPSVKQLHIFAQKWQTKLQNQELELTHANILKVLPYTHTSSDTNTEKTR